MLCGLRIKPAEGLLLDVPGKKPRDEVLGKGRRRAGADRHAKLVEVGRPQAVDLDLDRLAIRRWARHAGHAALRVGLPLRCGETSFATR